MKLAIELASSTIGQTSPNPPVGAVVVKDGSVVGVGCHVKVGEPHAEVHALNMAGTKSVGSTVYVTLEPCSHHGRTPPCADLLIEKKVKRVVIAIQDDNPKVSGKGLSKLKEAGIEVEVGVCHEEAKNLYKGFFTFINKKRPFITLKAALSLDGKLSTYSGDSKWITGEKAREKVHEERRIHDCILVGVGTVLQDNPSLTVRLESETRQPVRVILDSSLRTPIDSKIANTIDTKTIIFVGNQITEKQLIPYQEKGIEIIKTSESKVKVREVISLLAEKGYHSVYVEGGSEIHTSFIEENLFDELILYYAPKLIGGIHNANLVNGLGNEMMKDVTNLTLLSVETIGTDIRMHLQNEVN